MSERSHIETAVACLEAPAEPQRQLWHPDRNEQMAAIEVLLASPISRELRSALREREQELARRAG